MDTGVSAGHSRRAARPSGLQGQGEPGLKPSFAEGTHLQAEAWLETHGGDNAMRAEAAQRPNKAPFPPP